MTSSVAIIWLFTDFLDFLLFPEVFKIDKIIISRDLNFTLFKFQKKIST